MPTDPTHDPGAVNVAKFLLNVAKGFNGQPLAVVLGEDPGECWVFTGGSVSAVQKAASDMEGFIRLKRRKIDRSPRRRS